MRFGMKKPRGGIDNNRILTPAQKLFLKKFIHSDLRNTFRLTGGTALSAFYLGHRLSEDLDFFSEEKMPFYIIERSLMAMHVISEISFTKQFDRNMFQIKLKDGSLLKVEFTHYPLKNIETPHTIEGLHIDTLLDIVVNKLCAIADRIDAKDYVDVYCALKKYDLSFMRIMGLAEEKCGIRGIRHILKSRLLQTPKGVRHLPLNVDITEKDIENLFKKHIKKMVQKEI